ncbi:MAG: hypothetical protein ACRERC_23505 [Candidatus Binatia bacterium]
MVIGLLVIGVVCGGVQRHCLAQGSDDTLRSEPGPAANLGWGMAAFGTNLGYMPAKFLYAVGGGLVALLAYGVTVGDGDVAKGIMNPAFGGTWAVTPEMLRGDEPIMFNGPTYEPQR